MNSRKVLNGILALADVEPQKSGAVLRALDKYDRLGDAGVQALLGKGRKDDSGDYTQGAELEPDQIKKVMRLFMDDADDLSAVPGFDELKAIEKILRDAGYDKNRIAIDLSIVRGLEYYTGPVFEAQLTFPVTNEDGETVVFGSVAGGGRYDDLVARFTGQQVPATGISIGVSRLISALKDRAAAVEPLVVVLVMDKENVAESFAMARELRAGGIRAEAYVGTKKFGDQLKYADRRGAAIAVIEGADERAKGEVQLKDLVLGSELAKNIESRAAWVKDRAAQISVKRNELVAEVRKMLARS
jgi:histidyl-tRNA synthetase